MQSNETPIKTEAPFSQHRKGQFIAVKDSRNRKVRGLWLRNGRYYRTDARIPRSSTAGMNCAKTLDLFRNW